ncbi:hypothetical protein HJC23_011163 [Cyclotella cryptica]|uniref:RanBP2-type domain-containing protein n=1 Tax=Cyclotella cryptica TaxID=29204 RepID=A0ABD3P3P7_9STRA
MPSLQPLVGSTLAANRSILPPPPPPKPLDLPTASAAHGGTADAPLPSSRHKPPAPPGPPPPGRASTTTTTTPRSLNIPANLFQMDPEPGLESQEQPIDSLEDEETTIENESLEPMTVESMPITADTVVSTPPKRRGQNASPERLDHHAQSTVVTADTVRSTVTREEVYSAQVTAENSTSPRLGLTEYYEDDAVNRKITRVDGKGLWRSWKRNFNSQFMAILDLIDNSLDASIEGIDQGFVGKCHINPDTYSYQEENWALEKTTGIAIINNCIKTMRPLQKCLEIYDSSKVDSGADHVGENGVGLKQACATLSDRSFVLMKNGSDSNCELGIIAEQLQRNEGAYLPAFQFSNDSYDTETPSLAEQMKDLFSQPNNADAAQCIAQYGSGLNGNGPSLDFGIERLCKHFDMMCRNFSDNPYVFAVIVDKVRNDNVEERSGVADDVLTKIQVNKLLSELRNRIPLTYLHIPTSFEFLVNNHRVMFKYWQNRMVEFTRFTMNVGTTLRFDDPRDDPQKCAIRLYVGFDTVAMYNVNSKKCGALFLYSRQSGRLITHHPDARTMLELSAGGTEYCSGLRIIVDDFEGHLPLNPTKQDIAFSEKACGDILKENLYKSVGAFVRMYYKFHIGKYGNKKTVLTKKVKEFVSEMKQSVDSLQTELCKLDLTTFELSNASIYNTSVGSKILRITGREKVGKDTLYRLLPEELPEPPRSNNSIRTPESMSHQSGQSFEPDSKKRKLSSVNGTWTCRICNSTNNASSKLCVVCKSHALESASLVTGTNNPHSSQLASAHGSQAPIHHVERVTENDVICDLGGMIDPTNDHPGNARFWNYFRKHEHQYLNAKQPQDHLFVASAILNQLTRSYPPARFFIKPAALFTDSRQSLNIVLKALRIYSIPSSAKSAHSDCPPQLSKGASSRNGSPIVAHTAHSDCPSKSSEPGNGNGWLPQAPHATSAPHTSTNVGCSPPEPEGTNTPYSDHVSQPTNPVSEIAEDRNRDECGGNLSQVEEHYKSLCEGLVAKAEELQSKAERRKHKYNEMVQKNMQLERENLELKSKIELLEKKLEASGTCD